MSNIDFQDTWRQNYASFSCMEFNWGSQLNMTEWPFVAWVSLIRLLKSLCERSSLKLAWLFHRRRQDCAFVTVSPDDTPENETKPGTAGAVEKFNNVPGPNRRARGHRRFAVITLYYVRPTARRRQSSRTNRELKQTLFRQHIQICRYCLVVSQVGIGCQSEMMSQMFPDRSVHGLADRWWCRSSPILPLSSLSNSQ